jgi:hypothetical protein
MSIALLLREALNVVAKALPAIWRSLRFRKAQPDLLSFETEEKIAALSEPGRIVLWHLADRSLSPGLVADKLREARSEALLGDVLSELAQAGLTDHDFAGNHFIRPELSSRVKQILKNES